MSETFFVKTDWFIYTF